MTENNLPSSKNNENEVNKSKKNNRQIKKSQSANKEAVHSDVTNVSNNKAFSSKDNKENYKVENESKKEQSKNIEEMKDTKKETLINSDNIDKSKFDEKDHKVKSTEKKIVVKKGGTGLALLAILIALTVGGVGYYCGQKKVTEFQQKFADFEQKFAGFEQQMKGKTSTVTQSDIAPDYSNITTELTALSKMITENDEKVALLEKELSSKEQVISALQVQLNKVDSGLQVTTSSSNVLLSETTSLVNHALQKLVLDNDVDTSIASLKAADNLLSKSSDTKVLSVRKALSEDIKQLLSINVVDQDAIMQRLSDLANSVDNLVVLNSNFTNEDSDKLSESIDDWKENATKTATSFLNHFIRITPKNGDVKELLAPDQDVYLRENIRLRLQIATMAVPRQQNDLYQQSLSLVASWVRSYFDTNSDTTQMFLKEIDELSEQSIYMDLPTDLSTLTLLEKLSSKPLKEIHEPNIKEESSNSLKKETEGTEIKSKPTEETQQ